MVIPVFLFHLKEFARNSYFLRSVLIATLSACIVQYMGLRSFDLDPYLACVRSALIGLWTSTVSAAGIIGFERFKGTLPYLLLGRLKPELSLICLISAAASFGLLAFPLSFIFWLCAGYGSALVPSLSALLGLAVFFISVLLLSFCIAGVFVLSPHALVYEGLILVPALCISGVFGHLLDLKLSLILSTLFPFRWGALMMLEPSGLPSLDWVQLLCLLASLLSWAAFAHFILRRCLKKARKEASVDLI